MLTINNTLEGYLKDVEILGNTIQDASNLADIRSVGDKVEGQELYEIPVVSCGKNLFNGNFVQGGIVEATGVLYPDNTTFKTSGYIKVSAGKSYVLSSNAYHLHLYDRAFNWIKRIGKNNFTVDVDGYVRFTNNVDVTNVQLEEGTQATPYEQYQEDKLTILSPVQIEKVGDVADRIVCKDGVWGVEKNTFRSYLKDFTWQINRTQENTTSFQSVTEVQNLTSNVYNAICKGFKMILSWDDEEHYHYGTYSSLKRHILTIAKNKVATIDDLNKFLLENNNYVVCIAEEPTFIPLPHDQQVKLRTFANKTNISFLTEIEGTIKAQVPKSLGATVNTHTEQINNLNKELDRVKKLEESTVSTVTTESDFTTVEATSNGYFEDVKLEGKTLVNKSIRKSTNFSTRLNTIYEGEAIDNVTLSMLAISNLTANGIKLAILNEDDSSNYVQLYESNTTGVCIQYLSRGKKFKKLSIYVDIDDYSAGLKGVVDNILILEGDHTQNPPSYFEGLKSVGQSTSEDGVDEIVVSSVKGDGNLIDLNISNLDVSSSVCNLKLYENNSMSWHINSWDNWKITQTINVKKNTEYYLNVSVISACNIQIYDSLTKEVLCTLDSKSLKFTSKSNSIIIEYRANDINTPCVLEGVSITASGISYTPHQSDKKRLLYYNNETQTWEKPILRQWDSIEKHTDGKYYYHQRSGEVVLNGSESWKDLESNSNFVKMSLQNYPDDMKYGRYGLCDKFTFMADQGSSTMTQEFISTTGDRYFSILLSISASKLSSHNAIGFKQWLQANPVTVVYQLAQEKVYECTNIDLITYANETNYMVNSGAIVPRTTLKVHNNISNVVKILQEKVSLLENKFIQGLKQVLAGDMYSLAELLYPEDFVEENPENEIMLLPFE